MTALPMDSYEPSPLDEGYSEAPLAVGSNGPRSAAMPLWLAQMPTQDRTQYIMSIMDSLPTAEVCEIVQRLRPRLYINFFQHLPPEVCLKVLGFLDPVSLIHTARASREWMLLAMDRKLWEHLYYLEGFRVIPAEVQNFEYELNSTLLNAAREASLKESHAARSLQNPLDDDSVMTGTLPPPLQYTSIFGGPSERPKEQNSSSGKGKEVMRGSTEDQVMADAPDRQRSTVTEDPLTTTSSLVIVDRSSKRKVLNWQYLYSQRRRLEANWEAAKFTNFQLPHPDHLNERHRECIYTIQHAGKYLVSGSRDKTLRVWNLDTQRLIHPPLVAHTGSVLCLQFDADPEEDLIVSGSSDATICLWKFSTGQLIHRMKKAHYESVLNVRFDKRVLVTCSKDKTIKIFNRHPLRPGDQGYPMTDIINPVPTFLNNYGFNPAPTAGLPVKPPYQIIAELIGHGAAVNAVQIHGDQVVSASGDRGIKIWNWPEQTCLRTFVGHNKGIACVQYDGRRIVSGSSDNEVKVFDKESGLEVASLRGHSDLVRTVQAGFGDLPYSVEEDREQAKAIDYEYFRAVDAGEVSRTVPLRRGRGRNAGSRKPQDITAYGAKLPPGGGGGNYGRIVSGSYDGNIIIWRRDKEGVWKAQHTLRQEEGAVAARSIRGQAPRSNGTQATAPPAEFQAQIAQIQNQTQPQAAIPTAPAITAPFAPGSQAHYNALIDSALNQGSAALVVLLQTHPHLAQSAHLLASIANLAPSQRVQMNFVVTQIASAVPNNQPTSHVAAQATQPVQANPPVPQAGAPAPAPAAPHHHHHTHRAQPEVYRVFKLQFDARRMISCSQTPIIVGWDFANGDKQIIEASRFFAPIE
ncbi:hypothetical protein BP6252_10614 [Coleophoma cylindrospora]|uniref:F-box domain-containing protein n=1 Tax=Coleophoma cylindrospora TaxID=1849047 RepID=A0A3D8QT24_9HELO|nr:hypothetical protein BP6252_10614 [Coleophoma cylindrospora]